MKIHGWREAPFGLSWVNAVFRLRRTYPRDRSQDTRNTMDTNKFSGRLAEGEQWLAILPLV